MCHNSEKKNVCVTLIEISEKTLVCGVCLSNGNLKI